MIDYNYDYGELYSLDKITNLKDDEIIVSAGFIISNFSLWSNENLENSIIQNFQSKLLGEKFDFIIGNSGIYAESNNIFNGITEYSDKEYEVIKSSMKIVGINLDDMNDSIYFNNDYFNTLVVKLSQVESLFTKLSGNLNTDKVFFTTLMNHETVTGNYRQRLKAVTIKTQIFDDFEEVANTLKTVLLYVSIAFSVFSCLLLINFIGVSIANKKKEIGILRAIGARSKDIFKIFFTESLIIGFINYVLSIIGIIVFSIFINSYSNIAFMNYGFRQIGLIFGLVLIITTVATLITVYKFAKKKPIDTINDK